MLLRFQIAVLTAVLVVLFWSGYDPADRFTWILEVFPVFIGLVIAGVSYRTFPLTRLLYILIAIHCMILCMGGKYTYAEVPLGAWMQKVGHFSRNHYDRIGHFFQGFQPAILSREILIRKKVVNGSGWRIFLILSICLGFSALYELIEWAAAEFTGSAADAFLGTQGDPWDTQWDMFFALVGASAALIFLHRWHDRELSRLASLT